MSERNNATRRNTSDMQTPARDAQKRHADGTPGSHGTKNPTKKTWHDEAMERARKEVDISGDTCYKSLFTDTQSAGRAY